MAHLNHERYSYLQMRNVYVGDLLIMIESQQDISMCLMCMIWHWDAIPQKSCGKIRLALKWI